MTAWASIPDVAAITGITVDAATLAQAQAAIEIYVNRTPDADEAASARDLHWLKQAVCWQSAWLTEQPMYHARSTFEFQIQDGTHLRLNAGHELQLAPLATRAIRNLSWMGNRTLTIAPTATSAPIAFNNEASDWTHGWEPLP